MRKTSLLVIVSFVFSAGMTLGCGTVPKPEELEQLEERLRADDAQQLRELPNSARYHHEARQYRRAALEALEERNVQRSQEYAKLGMLRYRTAEAIYRQFETIDDLEEINEQIEEINPELRETMEARNELAAEIRELDADIREAVQEREQRRLAAARGEEGGFDPAGGPGGSPDAEMLEETNEKIAEAERLRDEALQFDADEYPETRGLFDRAETQLENARELVQENPRAVNTANRQVGFAVQLFEAARDEAEPVHEEFVEMMRPANRIDAIRGVGRDNFGADFSEDDPGGVRLILARLFEQGEDDFHHGTEPMLDALADIADEYHEFDIDIVGHTRAGGGATEARALSQARAQKVQDELVDAGIEADRLSHRGEGHDDVRFRDSPDNNDRVEVILRHEER